MGDVFGNLRQFKGTRMSLARSKEPCVPSICISTINVLISEMLSRRSSTGLGVLTERSFFGVNF